MHKITLNKALKLKNRLVNKMNVISERMDRDNSRRVRDTDSCTENSLHTERLLDMWQNIISISTSVVDIKTKISDANASAGINNKIFNISELKSQISQLRRLPVMDVQCSHNRYGENHETVIYHAAIDINAIDSIVEDIQADINLIQDEIDELNATTFILMDD